MLKSLSTPDDALASLCAALEATCEGKASSFQLVLTEVLSEVEDPLDAMEEPSDAAEADARLQREQARMFAQVRVTPLPPHHLPHRSICPLLPSSRSCRQVRLGELKSELAAKIAEEDDEGAAELKVEMSAVAAQLVELDKAGEETPEMAQAREARCLRLCALLLQAPEIAFSGVEVSQLGQRFLPPLQSHDAELRELAIRCLGMLGHVSASAAKSYFPLLEKAVHHETQQVQLTALRAVCDLLLVHSPAGLLESAAPEVEGSIAIVPVVPLDVRVRAEGACVPAVYAEDVWSPAVGRLLGGILALPSSPLRTTAALGLAKLIQAGMLTSSSLLAKLLLVCFDGTYDGAANGAARKQAEELAQQLSLFFAAAAGKASGLAGALLTVVRTVYGAAEGSREASVDVDGVIAFALGLVSAETADDDADAPDDAAATLAASMHMQLCACFTCEALLNLDGPQSKALPRSFATMSLRGGAASHTLLVALRENLADLAAAIDDKTTIKAIERAREQIEEMISSSAPEPNAESVTGAAMLAAYNDLHEATDASLMEGPADDAAPPTPAAAKPPAAKPLAVKGAKARGVSAENANGNAIRA